MKTTVTFNNFRNAFAFANRSNNFSYAGLEALFNYLEEIEQETGEEMELDVIAICCDYSEDTLGDIVENYSIDVSEADDASDEADIVEEYLQEHTSLVARLDGANGVSFVYANF